MARRHVAGKLTTNPGGNVHTMRRLQAGALGVALVVAACSSSQEGQTSSTTSAVTTSEPASPSTSRDRSPATTKPATKKPATTKPSTSARKPPATAFGDGTFKVSVDIAPGVYEVLDVGDGCHWQTIDASGKTLADEFVDIAPRVQATISPKAVEFNSDHCGMWREVR